MDMFNSSLPRVLFPLSGSSPMLLQFSKARVILAVLPTTDRFLYCPSLPKSLNGSYTTIIFCRTTFSRIANSISTQVARLKRLYSAPPMTGPTVWIGVPLLQQCHWTFLRPLTVPYCQLLSALVALVGVSGPFLAWFRSYLSSRTQQVVVDGCSSEVHPVTSGVLQGSILGPLLFSIYMNSITNTQFHQATSLILYADDILLYRPVSTSNDALSCNLMLPRLLIGYTCSAGLSLNAGNLTSFIFSCKFSQPVIHIVIYNTVLPTVDSIRFLGVVILTSDLKWNSHAANTCLKARQQLGIVHCTFPEANSSILLHLYRCLVLPTLDYCSSVWDRHTNYLVNKLESVQQLAIRLISKHWPSSVHTTNYRSLNL